jgi:hypothetical protein
LLFQDLLAWSCTYVLQAEMPKAFFLHAGLHPTANSAKEIRLWINICRVQ